MGKRKNKCYAAPKSCFSRSRHFCDGCVTNSSKCPFRNKQRDLRASDKRTDKKFYFE